MRKFGMPCLLALVVSCSGGPDAAPVEIKVQAGDAGTLTLEQRSSGQLTFTIAGKATTQDLGRVERWVYRDLVEEARDGRPVKVKREIRDWWVEAPGAERRGRSLQGKTLLLREEDGETVVEGAAGAPRSEVVRNRLGMADAWVSPPAGPLKPGQTWDLDPARLERAFGGDGGWNGMSIDTASGTGKLQGFETTDAGLVAVVSVDILAEGLLIAIPDVAVTLGLQGTFRISLARSRVLSVEAQGAGRLAGTLTRAGGDSIYAGEFSLDIRATFEPEPR